MKGFLKKMYLRRRDYEHNLLPTSSRPFHYEALDAGKHQIRLLTLPKRIKSDADGAIIQCTLETLNFETWLTYVALSHVWGPPSPNYIIKINGRPLAVRKNLHDFLVEASQPVGRKTHWGLDWTEYRYLWIDQICIDQNNLQEQANRVSRIGQIYANASETIL
jgi:hypothetical protein